MTPRALLTDIDNTLFDWPAFFAPSFRAMVHALSRELCIPYEDLNSEFKEVYGRFDSLEFSFSIQELKSVRALGKELQNEMVRTGRGAFMAVARKHLKPYHGVIPTLKWLTQQGYLIICVTNSPAYLAQKRLYELGIDRYVEMLIAWEGVDPITTTDDYVKANLLRRKSRVNSIMTFAKGDSKPSSIPYELALDACDVPHENVWVIGDSISKDLLPAAAMGLKTIWAKYGVDLDRSSKNYQTLLSITNWSPREIEMTHASSDFVPQHTADNFSDVRAMLPVYQFELF